jgi:hypothetical protein
MRVACSVEEGHIKRYTRSVSISRMANSLARPFCGMMSCHRILVSIEIFAATARTRSGNGRHVFFAHELNS